MINRDSRGHQYPTLEVKFLDRRRRTMRKHLSRIGRSYFVTRPAPYEKPKFLGSRGSMVAKLKLKEIDGRAPPGVEPAA
ncbi:hypothetical protein V9T40_009811 [Parthenolecanium corni]|uniref:Uncharacterized protein n=1 Tax=Parthenolecanium corni TaxID=536013 RepID=A0AAN9TQ61_9HEMI